MNCEWTKDNIALYIYDELADDARHQLEHHAQHCPACRREIDDALEFKESMAALPVEEVSPNLLAASRMKLQESLEHAEQSRGMGRFIFDLAGWMHQLRLAPALTVALLMVGFAGGSLTTWRLARTPQVPIGSDQASLNDADIVGVESIVPADPNSNRVVIKYNTQRQQTIEGASDDPRIHQLLLLGTRGRNSDVQLDSIDILTRKIQDNQVRETLIYSLRYDVNPGVRLKSLVALKSWIGNDNQDRDAVIQVRDAVVEALIHDSNPGVRREAIKMLDQMRADTSVHEALQVLAKSDKDSYIRSEAKRVLANSPTLY